MSDMYKLVNKIDTWRQGYFVDQIQYTGMSEEWKAEARAGEALLVRAQPESNAICQARTPEDAAWIAQRLNIAAQSESRSTQQSVTLAIPDRGKFEKWAKDKGHGRGIFEFRRSGHCYHDGLLEELWRSWQYAVENN